VTNKWSRWFVPLVALVLGLLITLAEMGQHASPTQLALGVVIVGAYALALVLLQSRSETASLLAGIPVDERWSSINQRALASAAQVIAVATVGAFIVVEFAGGDAMPYASMAAIFAVAYLGSILWFRWRS
jgi:hypothetical protein